MSYATAAPPLLPLPANAKLVRPSGSTAASLGASKLLYLDGLRGLAALYVVLHHAYLEVNSHEHSRPFALIEPAFELGRFAVGLFIVLSGFCLMLPILRSVGHRHDSVCRFLSRRAIRILPPYYIAAGFSLLCIGLLPGMGQKTGSHWDIALPAWSARTLISHLLLCHNVLPGQAYRINHALWSVATECQIYVLFPLMLVPVWRKWGPAGLLVTASGFAAACLMLFPQTAEARPWYLALFSLGMLAASVSYSDGDAAARLRESVRWDVVAAGFALCTVSLAICHHRFHAAPWVLDGGVGLLSSSVLIFCAQRRSTGGNSRLLGVVQSPAAVWLGSISYSLYLIHAPIIALLNQSLHRHHVNPQVVEAVLLTVGVAVSVLAGWAFHVAVERRFMPPPRTQRPRRPVEFPAVSAVLLRPAM